MRLLVILCLLFTVNSVFSQDTCDVIIKVNGDEIRAIVKEVGIETVSYIKCDNPSGPNYKLSRDQIFMIRFKDGTNETFKQENKQNPNENTVPQTSNKKVKVPVDVNYFISSSLGYCFAITERSWVFQGVNTNSNQTFGFMRLGLNAHFEFNGNSTLHTGLYYSNRNNINVMTRFMSLRLGYTYNIQSFDEGLHFGANLYVGRALGIKKPAYLDDPNYNGSPNSSIAVGGGVYGSPFEFHIMGGYSYPLGPGSICFDGQIGVLRNNYVLLVDQEYNEQYQNWYSYRPYSLMFSYNFSFSYIYKIK